MTNYQNGVVNYVLTQLHFGDFFHHDWYATTFSQLGIVTALIVWGAAAVRRDHGVRGAVAGPARARRGGGDRRRAVAGASSATSRSRSSQPVLLILTSLSIIWDFAVFTQPFLLIGQAHTAPGRTT